MHRAVGSFYLAVFALFGEGHASKIATKSEASGPDVCAVSLDTLLPIVMTMLITVFSLSRLNLMLRCRMHAQPIPRSTPSTPSLHPH